MSPKLVRARVHFAEANRILSEEEASPCDAAEQFLEQVKRLKEEPVEEDEAEGASG